MNKKFVVVTEPFEFFVTAVNRGKPFLQYCEKGPYSSWVFFTDGTLLDGDGFRAALDAKAMSDELRTLWRGVRPTLRNGATIAYGSCIGSLEGIPPEVARQARDIVCRYFSDALQRLLDAGLHQSTTGDELDAVFDRLKLAKR